MAYADQQMSGNRITAFVVVALIHVFVGYALFTGLAYSAMKQVIKKVTTVDIKKEEEKPPPPPPPPKNAPPPPIVAPPPPINVSVAPPHIETVAAPPPVAYVAPPAPMAPPPPRFSPKSPSPKGNPANWVTTEDYPGRALRENRTGTTGFRLSVGADGRVTGCEITSPSGSEDLDQATCTYAQRRARFAPATDGEGQPTSGSYSSRVKWVIPKD